MKRVPKPIYLLLITGLLIPYLGTGQSTKPKDLSDQKLIDAAREIMIAAGTCALITVDEEGRSRVRAMDPFPPEKDLTVWFGTNPKSRKVSQLRNDPRVTLYYLDSDASGYVMIHGTAELVNDEKEKEKRWKKEWEAFYPSQTEDYLLIKVSPEWMEVISEARGILGDPATWEPPVVFFDSN